MVVFLSAAKDLPWPPVILGRSFAALRKTRLPNDFGQAVLNQSRDGIYMVIGGACVSFTVALV